MSVVKFTKHPDEEFPFAVAFTNSDGTTTYSVSSAEVEALDKDGNDVTSTVTNNSNLAIAGNEVAVWVRAGVTRGDYRITVTATMATGEKLTQKLLMEVVS